MSGVFMFVGLFHFASWLLDAAPASPASLCAASSRNANRGRPKWAIENRSVPVQSQKCAGVILPWATAHVAQTATGGQCELGV